LKEKINTFNATVAKPLRIPIGKTIDEAIDGLKAAGAITTEETIKINIK